MVFLGNISRFQSLESKNNEYSDLNPHFYGKNDHDLDNFVNLGEKSENYKIHEFRVLGQGNGSGTPKSDYYRKSSQK